MKKVILDGALPAVNQVDVFELIVLDKLFVGYLQQDETMVIEWEGEVDSSELRCGYSRIVEQVCLLKPRKLQINLLNRSRIKRADQRWIFKHIFPEVLRVVNDDVFVAVVLPVSSFHTLVSDLSGDELMYNNQFLILQHFLYPEEAQRWLNGMCLRNTGSCG